MGIHGCTRRTNRCPGRGAARIEEKITRSGTASESGRQWTRTLRFDARPVLTPLTSARTVASLVGADNYVRAGQPSYDLPLSGWDLNMFNT